MAGKVCEGCQQPYKGFGNMCSGCRKGGVNEWSHCPECHEHFRGSGLCSDCKAGHAKDGEKDGVKITDKPAGKCDECGKEIGFCESISSKGKEYHPECFKCGKCGENISGTHKVEFDGNKTCKACLDKELCEGCQKPLGAGSATILNGKFYHPNCLKCDGCDRTLTAKFCPYKGKLLCTECGDNPEEALKNSPKKDAGGQDTAVKMVDGVKKHLCDFCHKKCKDSFLNAKGKFYHPDCFKCSGCDNKLPQNFIPKDGSNYCGTECLEKKAGEPASGGYPTKPAGSGVSPRLSLQPAVGASASDRAAVSPRASLQPVGASPSDKTGVSPRTSLSPSVGPRGSLQPAVGATPSDRVLPRGSSPRPIAKKDDMCDTCGEHIDGTVTKAGGKHYHPECFVCAGCKGKLGETFYPIGQNNYCEKCGKETALKDNPECGKCKTKIVGIFKKLADGSAICADCSPTDSCAACGKTLTGQYLHFDGNKFHNECFKCEDCEKSLDGGVFKGDGGKRLCKGCAEQRRDNAGGDGAQALGICLKCGKTLTGSYVEADGSKFHKDCFSCDQYGQRIDGSYHIEKPSGKYSLKVHSMTRNKYICECCD
mmetsp:Transcript_56696/g.184520  ORF Transcript_56696/g.184520 Transcript_56696/m.184520 type:complete len:595 (+) Transcript_56696:61-1845(+)